MLDQDKILEALSHVNDPLLHRSLTYLKMVRDVQLHRGKVVVTITMMVPNCSMKSKKLI
jgi:ATP-binding protein involved in chromosome partitioning